MVIWSCNVLLNWFLCVIFTVLCTFCCRSLMLAVGAVIWAVTCRSCIISPSLESIRHQATLVLQLNELACFANTGAVWWVTQCRREGGGANWGMHPGLCRGWHLEGWKYGTLKFGCFWRIGVCIAERFGENLHYIIAPPQLSLLFGTVLTSAIVIMIRIWIADLIGGGGNTDVCPRQQTPSCHHWWHEGVCQGMCHCTIWSRTATLLFLCNICSKTLDSVYLLLY